MLISDFINIHTHFKPLALNEFVIRNAYLFPQKPTNTQCGFSYGIHPWFVSKYSWDQTEKTILQILAEPGLQAVGEIGLDKLKPLWDKQIYFFEKQTLLAQKFNKPVIVHCVKSFYELIPVIKKINTPFILHGYEGNLLQTQALAKMEHVYFSFGPGQFRNPAKVKATLDFLSPHRIFLETDTHRMPVERVYREALKIVKIKEAAFRQQIQQNYQQVFGISSSYNQ
ncbi:MAG: TatD family hydrolase [Bacteroidota bacterium]|nr:TatD family hydrolase [Bacteroidota bacterium]